jgi:methylenetetrahydrofolate reductase (NADPH)
LNAEIELNALGEPHVLANLLRNYSAEVTCRDEKSIRAAEKLMPPGSEVFIVSLPSDKQDRSVAVAAGLRNAGLVPVPHLVARNIGSRVDFEVLLRRLTSEAGVDRALILGGDRSEPIGAFDSSQQLLETGLLEASGIRKIKLSWYPEGHPRISDSELAKARAAKLRIAAARGLEVELIGQFCFESAPIIASARHLRAEGIQVPLRVGVAGPASRASLLKYAMICGVGASVRALKERPGTRSLINNETPERLLRDVAHAQAEEPRLGIHRAHFFTFASLASTVQFVEQHSAQRLHA